MIRYLFAAFILLSSSLFAYKSLLTKGDYIFELYEPSDRIPVSTLCEGLLMYYQAYLEPRLHVGIPLSELKIDETRFGSYEEFIEDMFYRDFLSYQTTQKERCYYFQVRYIPTNQVVSLCVILREDEPGFYYMDHIGTHKDFRRRGLASTLIELLKRELAGCNLETAVGQSQKVQDFESESLVIGAEHSQTVKAAPITSDYGSKDCAFRPDPTAVSRFKDISLDTRMFNTPAQALYTKSGFKRLSTHPIPGKQTIYFRYVYNELAERAKPPQFCTESK